MTPQKIENLRDLFIEQGKELYNIALHEEKELPAIKKKACDPNLKAAIDREIEAARDHRERLRKAFGELNIELEEQPNESAMAILNQAKELMERSSEKEVRDAAIITAVQKLNHNKIAGFGSFRSFANEIGEAVIADTFRGSIQVERDIDETLSNLAMDEVNKKAVVATNTK